MKRIQKIVGYVIMSAKKESCGIIGLAILVGIVEGICTQLTIMVYREIGSFIHGEGSYLKLLIPFCINILLSPHYYLYLPLDEFMRSVLFERLRMRLLSRVFECTYHRDMTQLEDATLYERVTKASEDTIDVQYRKIVDAIIYIPLNISCFISVIVVLATHSIWLALIALVGLIPTFYARILQGKGYFDLYSTQTKKRQYLSYLWNLLNSYGANRDMKVWNHGDRLREEYSGILEESIKEEWSLEKKNFWRMLLLDSLQPLSIAIAILLSVYFIYSGEIEIAVFAALLKAMISVNETSSNTIAKITDLLSAIPYIENFFHYVESKEMETEKLVSEGLGFHQIEFRNVCFHYPSTKRNCIDHVSFQLNANESVSLVGENGSGKSTLIKLLLRIYLPTQGEILMDGININDYEEESYYRKISAVFQNYVRYQLTLRENLAMGNLSKYNDTEYLMKHLENYQIGDLVGKLPQGLDTTLGREFGEIDLSGGQWQKIAIARGGLKASSLIVLDEPTASIDPVAESEIFHRFKELTKDCCSIIISHRIGAAKIAKRILVLEHGKLVEDGTHEELMKKHGIYRDLYEMQAKWYLYESVAASKS